MIVQSKPNMISDNELLGLYVVNDDQSAFEQLIERHASMVMHVCRAFLWNQADCDDAFQSVFALLSRKSKSLLKHSSIGGWLHNAAVNVSLTKRRTIRRQREVEIAHEPKSTNPEPWESIANAQECEKLHLEIARLPRKYRDVIVLCHLNGASRSEAADSMDITTSAVKAALARARKLLRQRLVQQGIGLSTILAVANLSAEQANAASQISAIVKSTCGQIAASSSKFASTNPNLFQLISSKGLSAMPIGIVHTSLAIALGLVSLGAIGIGAMSSVPVSNSKTVVVSQEVEGKQPADAVMIQNEDVDELELTDESFQLPPKQDKQAAELIKNSIQAELSQLQVEYQRAQASYSANHPECVELASRIKMLKQVQRFDFGAAFSASRKEKDRNNDGGKAQFRSTLVIDQKIAQAEIGLQVAIQRFGANHPTVQAQRQTVEMWRQFRENSQSVPELKPIDNTREEDQKKLEKLFQYKPFYPGAVYSQPKSLDGIVLSMLKNGFEATDVEGNVLRRFLDTNRDSKLDVWIYFKNGTESYRDIDRDFDKRVEEAQFTDGDAVRIGKDPNRDGTIDQWVDKRLSDMRK